MQVGSDVKVHAHSQSCLGNQTANCNKVDALVVVGYVHCHLKQHGGQRDPAPEAIERQNRNDCDDGENNSTSCNQIIVREGVQIFAGLGRAAKEARVGPAYSSIS